MKNTLIRIFVVALALSGAAATTVSSTAPRLVAGVSALPAPMCPPGGEDGCGIR